MNTWILRGFCIYFRSKLVQTTVIFLINSDFVLSWKFNVIFGKISVVILHLCFGSLSCWKGIWPQPYFFIRPKEKTSSTNKSSTNLDSTCWDTNLIRSVDSGDTVSGKIRHKLHHSKLLFLKSHFWSLRNIMKNYEMSFII